MMLEQVRAGLNKNKKGISNIIVTVLLITILMLGILIFWTAIRRIVSKSPEELNCIDLISSLSLQDACYLNENEIKVTVKRGFDEENIERLRFVFGNFDDSIWEITGKKCSDVRVNERRYGGYCDILKSGQGISYIFNMAGIDKKERVRLGAGSVDNLCEISEVEIEKSC